MPIKMVNYGQSGHGKTGALAALCAAGYNVRVADLENGVETLVNLLNDPSAKYPKEAIDRLRWITLTEKMRVLAGNFVPMGATVWPKFVDLLGVKWKGDKRFDRASQSIVDCTDDLGSPYTWTEKEVLAIDTLSSAAEAGLNHNLQMQGALGGARTSMEGMRDAGSAQTKIDKFLQFLADQHLGCNVVINTHINWAKENGKNPEVGYDGELYAFPSAIGKALNATIGKHFNHMLMTRKVGQEYRIYTRGVPNAGLKSGAPLRVKDSYPIHMGLADYFADVNKVGGAKP